MKKSTDIILNWRGGKMDFRELFDIIPDGIVLVGTDGYIIQANKAQAKMYGYKSAGELIGFFATDFVASSVTELAERITSQGQGSLEILPVEYEMRRKDGTRFWVEIIASPQKNEENEISGYLCITREITRRKLAEKAASESEQEIREKERALISREIHDQLGQSLTALKIDINWLQRKARSGNEIKDKLNAMTELLTNTIKDIQRISSELRPSILDDIGLAAAMEWYCEDFSNRTGLTVKMDFENIQFENMNSNIALYRVMQESLTNIVRHAKAKTVNVKLCSAREKIILLIHDDGVGIPNDKIKSPLSFGLLGMFERIKYAGGRMNISKPAAGGTKILVRIPLENNKL